MNRFSEELRQLAHMLRVGGDCARDIVFSKPDEILKICDLATQAKQIAGALDEMSVRLEEIMPACRKEPGGER